MSTARESFGAAAVNGIIYVMGGYSGGVNAITIRSVEAYNPSNNTWTKKADMPGNLAPLGAAEVDGIINAVGEYATYAYNPLNNTWIDVKAPMLTRRSDFGIVAVEGIIYAIGGEVGPLQDTNIVEAYNPKTDKWTTQTSMPTPRSDLGVAAVENVIYAIGGVANNPSGSGYRTNTVEAYYPTEVPPMSC